MSEKKRTVIDELWQELVDAQRAKEQALADKLAAKIMQAQREKRAQEEKTNDNS